MKKISSVLFMLVALPTAALAAGQNNVGCGWGSKLFEGQSGIGPQVFAATSNSFYGTQTFAITSGTSGCTQDGTVTSTWKTAMFIDGNKDKLARDMSVGSGETLASLSHLLGVEAKDQAAFNRLAKDNVARIFTSESAPTEQVVAALREVLAADATLSRYQAAL